MSIAIPDNAVTQVLLCDHRWYPVQWVPHYKERRSSFYCDAYEIVSEEGTLEWNGGKLGCATGASWVDRNTGQNVACPMTSILAIQSGKEEKADAGQTRSRV